MGAFVSIHALGRIGLNTLMNIFFSPFPEDSIEFSTLFCRYLTLDLVSLTIQLRDFPQPMLDVNNMHVWGRFIGAEQEAPERGTSVVMEGVRAGLLQKVLE